MVLISSSAHLHQLWASLGKVGIGMGTENKKKKSKIIREKIAKIDTRKYVVEMLARMLYNQRWRK